MIQRQKILDTIKTLPNPLEGINNRFNFNDDVSKYLKWTGIITVAGIADIWLLSPIAASVAKSFYSGLEGMGMGNIPSIPSPGWYLTHPFTVISAFIKHITGIKALSTPQVFYTWTMINIMLASLVASFKIRKVKDDFKISKEGLHGTAKFLNPDEATEFLTYNYQPGIMFGGIKSSLTGGLKPAILKEEAPGNRNVAVFGPPGSRKSSTYISNNMFQAVQSGQSIIVTDPKGELTRLYSKWLKKKGYTVKIFNLVNMLNSDRWNPLDMIHDELSAQHFCNIVIANTASPQKKGGDPFWENLDRNLLKALVLYIVNEMPPANRNLGTLYSLLSGGSIEALDSIFEGLRPGHPAKIPYNFIKDTSETVKTGTITSLGGRLEVFQNKLICELTAGSDLDIELPGQEKCAYFCILSDKDSTFDFLASLFFSFLFIRLTDLADRQPSGVLKVKVHALLDEFCNISNIPDFTKKLSTMRGRGIGCSIVFQNIPQLMQSNANKTWEIILGDCDFWLILGAKEMSTAEYISKMVGTTTVEDEKETKPKGMEGLNPFSGSIMKSATKRSLMDPSEIRRLKIDECILSLADGQVIKLNKFWYKHHRWANDLEEEHISNYLPEWAINYKAKTNVTNKVRTETTKPLTFKIEEYKKARENKSENKKTTTQEIKPNNYYSAPIIMNAANTDLVNEHSEQLREEKLEKTVSLEELQTVNLTAAPPSTNEQLPMEQPIEEQTENNTNSLEGFWV